MAIALSDAVAETCGGKAGTLGALMRAGVPVPDGFVVSFEVYRAVVGRLADAADEADAVRDAIEAHALPTAVHDSIARSLAELGDHPVAVRSSAANEDTADASAAGQYDSILAVRDVTDVSDALRACWASLYSRRAVDYRSVPGDGRQRALERGPEMAVLVQRLVDADVSGVMLTPTDPDDATEIEASWGLGPSVVGGTVTPDTYRIAADGSVTRSIANKPRRLDRDGTQLVTVPVPSPRRNQATLDDGTATEIARLGYTIAHVVGRAQDVEWAIADGCIWVLQARPVTAALPPRSSRSGTVLSARTTPKGFATLTGTPGSEGSATGSARIVRGAAHFARVTSGDIIVCSFTDPAWTPLLRIAAGVVTETGGALSHAAIIARERRIPAVLGIPNVTASVHDGATITIDGAAGTVTTIDT